MKVLTGPKVCPTCQGEDVVVTDRIAWYTLPLWVVSAFMLIATPTVYVCKKCGTAWEP